MAKYLRGEALAMARGRVRKFGGSPDIDTTDRVVWDDASSDDYNWMDTAIGLQVSSSDANDTDGGTGTRTIEVVGRTAAGAEQSVTVTMNGQTAVVIPTLTWIDSIHRAKSMTAGSGDVNAGDIYVSDSGADLTNGVPDTDAEIRAKIIAGEGQTQMMVYTVPAGYDFCILQMRPGAEDSSDGFAWRIMYQENGGSARLYESGIGGIGSPPYRPDIIDSIPPRSRVWVTMRMLSQTNKVATAAIDGVLV